MPRDPAEHLTQLVTLGRLQLAAEVAGRHPVRLVDDDEIPIRALEEVDQLLTPGELVHSRDQQRVLLEQTFGSGLDELFGEQLEPQAEFVEQLVHPSARRNRSGVRGSISP